jgi:lambda repressor-like predicted transcriptional regulator
MHRLRPRLASTEVSLASTTFTLGVKFISGVSTAELTSDGGLTSPSLSNTPSPPLPPQMMKLILLISLTTTSEANASLAAKVGLDRSFTGINDLGVSTAELTSDGGLTSPSLSNTPSPPLPPQMMKNLRW